VRRLVISLIVCLLFASATARAHDVPVEPIVNVQLRPAADRLNVDVHVPIVGLADANLPRGDDRKLARPEVDDVLTIVGREFANSLAIQQDDQRLAPPAIAATIADDEQSVTFHLQYQWHADGGPLSARLHTVSARPRPLRMTAQFFATGDEPRTFSVAGEPERVVFEPRPAAVAAHFGGHAVRMLLRGGMSMLLLLCLIAPAREARELRTTTALLIAGHAAGLAFGAGNLSSPATSIAPAVAVALAASCAVVIAILNVAHDQSIAIRPVTAAAGLTSGIALGLGLREQAAFAGSHPIVAVAVFTVVTVVGLTWIAAFLAFALDLLRQRGLPERVAAIALSAYAAHASLHRFSEQTMPLVDQPSWVLGHFTELTIAVWLAIAIAIALSRALRGAARLTSTPPEWTT
jgi:hypothetical protein